MKRWGLLLLLVVFAGWIYFRSPPETGNVAVVRVEGAIYESDPIVRQLDNLAEDETVRAVVLRVDSPGGTIGASQEIHDAVRELAESKTVIASLGSVAASGGYYVALPAHKIIANPGTITGSIGVRMEYINLEELLRWARVRPETLKSGRWKDIGSPTRPLEIEERQFLQEILQKLHAQFKQAVVQARHLEPSRIETLAEGQIFTGEEAKAAGLIDDLGNLKTAVKLAANLAGIKEKPKAFYPAKEYEGFMERILGEAVQKLVFRVMGSVNDRFFFLY